MHSRLFKKLTFSEAPSDHSWRFGGGIPRVARLAKAQHHTNHFATVDVFDKRVSILLSFDYNIKGHGNPFYMAHRLFDESEKAVQFLVSEELGGEDIGPSGAFPLRYIDVSQVESEDGPFDDERGYPFHKVGGIPVFAREFSSIYAQCEELLNTHYHFLQIAFPVGPGDCVMDVDWPFGDMIFHAFVAADRTEPDFRYCWG